MTVRVVTFNAEGLQRGWFEGRDEAVRRALPALRPDVVCLQEVTVRHDPFYDQPAHIAEMAGLDYVAFADYGDPGRLEQAEQAGIAILSRWPLHHVRNRRLPYGDHDPPDGRVVLYASLMTPHGDLEVVTTHLAWRPDQADLRGEQVRLVLDHFVPDHWGRTSARAVLAGDFNATEDEPAIRLASERLRDAYRTVHPGEPGTTWSRSNPLNHEADAPSRRLDYIFCPRDVSVRQAEVVLADPDPVAPSDHYGLLAELAW